MIEEKTEQNEAGTEQEPISNVETCRPSQEEVDGEGSEASAAVAPGPRLITGSAGASNMTIHSVEFASTQRPVAPKNTVTVKISYPKDWKKYRAFKDGDIREVAKETADQFVSQGIAKLVKEEKK